MRLKPRHGLFALAFLAGLGAILAVAPYLVPTERVRLAVGRIVSSYLGNDVTLTGEVHVRLFPAAVDFRQARFAPTGDAAGTGSQMTADRIRVTVDLPQFLLGRSPVAAVDIVRPVIDIGATGSLPNFASAKRLARLTPIRVAVAGGTVRRATPAGPETVLTDLLMSYSWPRLGAKLRMTASFTWQGEHVALAAQGPSPRSLAAGETGDISLSAETSFLKASFAGKAVAVDRLQIDGPAALSLTDLPKAAALLGRKVPAELSPDRFELEGRLRSAGLVYTLQDTRLGFGPAHAEGVLSARFDGDRPILRGTLDMETIEIAPERLPPVAIAIGALVADHQAMDDIDVDLRLSADQIVSGESQLGEIGATLVINDGRIETQMTAGRVMGGEASLHVAATPDEETMRLRVDGSLDRIAAAPLWRLLGGSNISSGTVSARATLTATGDAPGEMLASARGRLTIAGRDLVLSGADAVSAARLPSAFETADIEAELQGTSLAITKFNAAAGQSRLALKGQCGLTAGTLDLAGTLTRPVAKAGATPATETVPAVLDGTRSAPRLRVAPGR